jgi:hypothetical protein
MSTPLSKIPYTLTVKLPRQALLDLFRLETITHLEQHLNVPDGTLSKVIPESPGYKEPTVPRGISAKVHQKLLEAIAEQFADSDEMRRWMVKHWPEELRRQAKDFLKTLYQKVDLDSPASGLPVDYIERDEKKQIMDILLNQKDVQVCWVSGPGGSGKSTLALSLKDVELKKYFDRILRVNTEAPAALEVQPGVLAQKHKVLFILESIHDVAKLAEWRRQAGTMGKLLVTSRVRLSEVELSADQGIRQILLGGFNKEQGQCFMRNTSAEVERLVDLTDGLPLALRILRALMDEATLSLKEILRRLETQPLDVLNIHEVSVRKCFEVTWNFLEEKHPEALNYLRAAGLFHTRMIDKRALDQAASISDPVKADRIALLLKRYQLLDIVLVHTDFPLSKDTLDVELLSSLLSEIASPETRYIQLHSLIHAYVQEKPINPEGYWKAIIKMASGPVHPFRVLELRYHLMDILVTYWDLLGNGRTENALGKLQPMVDEILHALSQGRSQGRSEYDLLAPISRRLVESKFYVWLYDALAEVVRYYRRDEDAKAYCAMARKVEMDFKGQDDN